jgi:CDP-diacylglycerol--glycerol-3-phosphate 3-phosphatidyltransferase
MTNRSAFLMVQALTVARIPLCIAVAALLLVFRTDLHLWVLVTCTVLLIAAELTDMLDGMLSRKLGVTSEIGATLDPYADSVSRIIVYWGLACVGLANVGVPLVLAVRDVTASYCRIVWVRSGKSAGARISGKVKAVVQAAGAFLLLLSPLYMQFTGSWVTEVVSWCVIAVTAWSGCDYAAVTLRQAGKSS